MSTTISQSPVSSSPSQNLHSAANMASEPTPRNIVIIGGGIIGCTTAYYLTRHPSYSPEHHKITILEATSIASGASGKAGGLLALWAYPKCLVPLSFRLHRDLAEEHGGKEKWGYRGVGVGNIELVGRKVPKDSIRAATTTNGTKDPVSTTHKHDIAPIGDGSGNASDDISLQKELGLNGAPSPPLGPSSTGGLPSDLDWVASECIRGWQSMGTPRDTAQVHPYEFTTSIARLAQDRGAALILGKATEILVANGTATGVRYTDSATQQPHTLTDATDVIVTAGPWTQRIWPGAPIGSLRAHSVCIRPSRPVSAYALFTDLELPKNFRAGGPPSRAMAVSPEIYARPNNELYACGEGDQLVPLPETSADVAVDGARCQDIVDYCAAFSDEMRDGEVLVRQACYLPTVEYGGGPLVGATRTKGVWVAAGHTCWGIQNGPATGKVMSELVFEGEAKSAKIASLDPKSITRR